MSIHPFIHSVIHSFSQSVSHLVSHSVNSTHIVNGIAVKVLSISYSPSPLLLF